MEAACAAIAEEPLELALLEHAEAAREIERAVGNAERRFDRTMLHRHQPRKPVRTDAAGGPVGGGAPGGGSLGGGGGSGGVSAQILSMAAPAAQAMPVLASFDDVLALIAAKRDIGLRLDVEQFVRPISFRPGAITYEAAPGAKARIIEHYVAANEIPCLHNSVTSAALGVMPQASR